MTQAPPDYSNDPRVYFAAERTLLAWVRTGLAMMGFGFVVARFGLFLRELAVARNASLPPLRHGLSLWVGITLVVLGVGVNVAAVIVHWHTVRRLEKGERLRFRPFSLASMVGVILAVIGLATAAYLVFGLKSAP